MSKQSLFKYSPYSASKLGVFGDCPYKFQLKYIDKVKVPFVPQPFFEKGSFLHYGLEHYPNKPEKQFKFTLSNTQDINKYKGILRDVLQSENVKKYLLKESVKEHAFKVSENMDMDFDSYKTLFRGFIDYYSISEDTAIIIDWKSGKVYKDKSDDQLKIYALWMFISNEKINNIECSYFYIEHDYEQVFNYTRDNLDELISYFIEKIEVIEKLNKFKKRPSRNCRYCDYNAMCRPEQLDIKRRKNLD